MQAWVGKAWWNTCHVFLHVRRHICLPLTRLLWALNHVTKAGLRKHIQCHENMSLNLHSAVYVNVIQCHVTVRNNGVWSFGPLLKAHTRLVEAAQTPPLPGTLFWVWADSSRSAPTLHKRCQAPALPMEGQSLTVTWHCHKEIQHDSLCHLGLQLGAEEYALLSCFCTLTAAGCRCLSQATRAELTDIKSFARQSGKNGRFSPSVHQFHDFLTSEIPAAESDLSDFDVHMQIHTSKAFIHASIEFEQFNILNGFSAARFAVPFTLHTNSTMSLPSSLQGQAAKEKARQLTKPNHLIGIVVRSLSAGSHWLDLSWGDFTAGSSWRLDSRIRSNKHHQNKLKTPAAITALKVVALMQRNHEYPWING